MKLNQEGINLIKQFEGCRLTAYQDSGGIWTIGYGQTGKIDGKPIVAGMTITQEKAEQLFKDSVNKVANAVDKLLTRELNDNQFSALVSLAYNIGLGNLERSTLMNYVQAGQLGPAASQFTRWDKVNGVVLKGLQVRRDAERKLFEKPI